MPQESKHLEAVKLSTQKQTTYRVTLIINGIFMVEEHKHISLKKQNDWFINIVCT